MEHEFYIVKIGGDTLNDADRLKACLQACVNSQKSIILVHGGGKKVTELAQKLGIETQMVDGRRITNQQTMDLCTMVYAGLISKTMVAQLYQMNQKAVGLSGADFNCIISEKRKHPTIDFGQVGDVKKVDASFFSDCLKKNVLPVVCSVTLSDEGELLNTNADSMAAAIANAMIKEGKTHLVYCFEKKGVLTDLSDENTLVKKLNQTTYNEMKNKQLIADGMIPKLDTALEVKNNGAESVAIIQSSKLENYFSGVETGTQIIAGE